MAVAARRRVHKVPTKGVREASSVRHAQPHGPARKTTQSVPLPREFAHLSELKVGDVLHLVLPDGCADRTVSALIPGRGYALSNGASVRAGTAVFYHLPGRCPGDRPTEPAHHETVRDFKIPSSTHPGIVYTVHVSETGMLVCNCGAGSYGRPCKHKHLVAELLQQGRRAA